MTGIKENSIEILEVKRLMKPNKDWCRCMLLSSSFWFGAGTCIYLLVFQNQTSQANVFYLFANSVLILHSIHNQIESN